jgi:hypothetical protein
VSPLRKAILDLTSNTAHLKRPLTVKHLRTTGRVAYLEAQEPGKDGRTVRAFLERQADDPQGAMVWIVKDYSFQPSERGEDGWDNRLEKLVKSGVPASLFRRLVPPSRRPAQPHLLSPLRTQSIRRWKRPSGACPGRPDRGIHTRTDVPHVPAGGVRTISARWSLGAWRDLLRRM